MIRTLVFSVAAVAALGILIGVAVMLRGETPPEGVPRRSGPIAAAPSARMAALAPVEAPDPELLRQVDQLEGRLNQLLKRRDELARNNDSVRKEMEAIRKERGYKSNAPMFVASLGRRMGGATETQQAALTDIWVKWHTEDQRGEWRTEDEAQTRRRLLDREAELRALFSAEQQAKMQGAAAAMRKTLWWHVATDLASDLGYPVAGVSRQESDGSIKKVLGMMGNVPEAPSSTMMLLGAHGMDYPSLKRLAVGNVRPQLSPEDSKRLEDPTPQEIRRAIAGSWSYDWQ